jgi:hypothetical protein
MKAKNIFFFLKHHYATIISLSVITFIIIFFSCDSDNPNTPTMCNYQYPTVTGGDEF